MSRKIDIENINLKVDRVEPFEHDSEKGFVIEWSSDIGFGEYTFIQRKAENHEIKKWVADSEGMDNDEDRSFGKKLLELWMDQMLILG